MFHQTAITMCFVICKAGIDIKCWCRVSFYFTPIDRAIGEWHLVTLSCLRRSQITIQVCKRPHSTTNQKRLGFHSTMCLPFQNLNRSQSGGREQMEGLEFGWECEVRLTKHRGITTGSQHVWVFFSFFYGQLKWLTDSHKFVLSLKQHITDFAPIPPRIITFSIYRWRGGDTMTHGVKVLFSFPQATVLDCCH